MSAVTNEQILANRNAKLAQTLDLAEQRDGVDNNTVSNYTNLAAAQYPRRDQVENVFHTTMKHRVTGVIAALTSNDDVSLCGKHIDNLTLAFVAPLRSD